ncbi:hypothetical protein [Sinorhizobium meliloti]|uniref:hypothetical protein n=1 Tax=Rhizobium meliloti TaxID=382 RepID=UPI0013E29E36|nr:hypothetical protein [Sinorhizobium meliloti]MDW9365619.1 hypothetical protein [Sinorhizobium meliloti]
MTENSKTPPAKKTIEDPPEYGAASGDGTSSSWSGRGKPHEAETQENLRGQLKWNEQRSGETGAGYQQNGQSAVAPSETGDQAKKTAGTKDWLGGPQNGEEENHLGDWLGGPQNGAEAPASTDEERAPGEEARNPQTGERIARNPQTGE